MKKIIIIFAAMAAVLSSCSKSELESVSANDGKDIVLNISVSNPGADDTKALIKTGWAGGDEISIWYDTNTDSNPDLVIEYDAANTKWIQKQGATVSGNTPSEGSGKYAKALYNGTVKAASKDNYTYDGTTLTFNIANWKFLTEIQVVVYGDDINWTKQSDYTLSCDKFTPCTGCSIGANEITATTGTKGAAVTGIINDGVNSKSGVAFVFATADYSSTAAAFKFTLIDNTTTPAVTKEYTATTDRISGTTGSMTAIKALTIESNKFAKAAPEGFVDLGVVVNDKPLYWAEKNLGATNPQDYGKYFSWGDVEGQARNGNGFSNNFVNVFGTNFDKVAQDIACPSDVLAFTYDAAYQVDSKWRMPTGTEFKELFSQCYTEWGSYNKVNGLIVYKAREGDKGYGYFNNKMRQYSSLGSSWNEVSKKKPSYSTDSDTFVFFPVTGRGSYKELKDADTGFYWSSSFFSNSSVNGAHRLEFKSSEVKPCFGSSGRDQGCSIRPVSSD